MNREVQMWKARALRAGGVSSTEIGRRLGVSPSTIRNWLLGGDCKDCGTPITYKDTRHPTLRCHACHEAHQAPAKRGVGKVATPALAFLTEPRRYTEISEHLGISKGHTGVTLHRLLRYGLIRRVSHGVYIRATTPPTGKET